MSLKYRHILHFPDWAALLSAGLGISIKMSSVGWMERRCQAARAGLARALSYKRSITSEPEPLTIRSGETRTERGSTHHCRPIGASTDAVIAGGRLAQTAWVPKLFGS